MCGRLVIVLSFLCSFGSSTVEVLHRLSKVSGRANNSLLSGLGRNHHCSCCDNFSSKSSKGMLGSLYIHCLLVQNTRDNFYHKSYSFRLDWRCYEGKHLNTVLGNGGNLSGTKCRLIRKGRWRRPPGIDCKNLAEGLGRNLQSSLLHIGFIGCGNRSLGIWCSKTYLGIHRKIPGSLYRHWQHYSILEDILRHK